MTQPFVSIVMTAFQRPNLLRNTLQSIALRHIGICR